MRKYLLSVVGVLSLLIGLAATQAATQAATTKLTFDEFADRTTLTTQYQAVGVTVSGALVLSAPNSPWPANSGQNLVYAPTGLMTFDLDSTITGNIQTASAYVSGDMSIGIYAYDAAGVLVGQALTPGPGNNFLVSVTSSGNPIASVAIHDAGRNFTIDTLTFSTPVTVPFAGFTPSLKIATGSSPNTDSFDFASRLTLGTNGAAFNPAADVVSLKIGAVTTTIPAGSFKTDESGAFAFAGLIGGVNVRASLEPEGSYGCKVKMSGTGASVTGVTNPVALTLAVGNNSGNKPVTATITVQEPANGLFINPF